MKSDTWLVVGQGVERSRLLLPAGDRLEIVFALAVYEEVGVVVEARVLLAQAE
jgi:hypothetical protein